MDSKEYIAAALRTECDYGPVRARLENNPGLALLAFQALQTGISAGKFQTELKRSFIYGKGELLTQLQQGGMSAHTVTDDVRAGLKVLLSNPQALRLLHLFLGALTEAAEMQEHLFEVIFQGAAVDKTYLKGELGDTSWFQAGTCDELGFSLDEIQKSNIAKLRARFPDKFTLEQFEGRGTDATRDLPAETVALEEK